MNDKDFTSPGHPLTPPRLLFVNYPQGYPQCEYSVDGYRWFCLMRAVSSVTWL